MSSEIVSSLISAFIGGILVAIVNHFFTRKKTRAETEKIQAETKKISLETEKLSAEIKRLNENVEENSYYRSGNNLESIIFDSSKGMDNFDIEGFDGIVGIAPDTQTGKGTFSIKDKTAIVERTNILGAYTVILRSYLYKGVKHEFLPSNPLLSGKRKIRIEFQVKQTSGTSKLIVAIDEVLTNQTLDFKYVTIENVNSWKRCELFFKVIPDKDCYLRIHQLELTELSKLLLNSLIVAEKKD